MTIFLQLTTAGSDSGPFNLYSDSDGYTDSFDTNVFKSSLEAGYSTTAPDGTQTVKVVSTGACINSIYITLVLANCDLAGYVEEITTTTTTTTTLAISEYSYKRDGSQICNGSFHLPYIVYKDAYNLSQTIYLDECFDICDSFFASSIVSTHYATDCPVAHTYHFSNPGRANSSLACAFITFTNTFYSDSIALDLGSILYTDASLSTNIIGGDQWFQEGADGIAYQVDNSGVIIDFVSCV